MKVEFADFMPPMGCWPYDPGKLMFAKAFFKLASPAMFMLILPPSSESESDSLS